MPKPYQSTAARCIPAITALYFASGVAGLLYEMAWFRRLQLVFGVSGFAIGAVVSAFMLGLAAGSRWAGSARWVNRRPLLAYCWQEGALAIYAVLFPGLVVLVEGLYSALFPLLGGHFLTLSMVRLGLSLLLLLPATVCMGATLPTLARAVAETGTPAARPVGWLYAINTFGGAVGTLLAGFFTLEHFGIRGTVWLAAALNVAIAFAAFILSRKTGARCCCRSSSGACRRRTRPAGSWPGTSWPLLQITTPLASGARAWKRWIGVCTWSGVCPAPTCW